MDFDKPKVYGDTFISDGLVSFLPPVQSPAHEEGLLSKNGSRRKLFKSLHHPVGLNCVDLVVEFRSNIYILESGNFGQKKNSSWIGFISSSSRTLTSGFSIEGTASQEAPFPPYMSAGL